MGFIMMQRFMNSHRADDINYKEYIQSEEWKQKAEKFKQAIGYRCQLCNLSGHITTLHAHHNTYERLGSEWQTDIAILCNECHENFHKSGIKPGRKIKLSREEFLGTLKRNEITFTNDDPWRYYERGKVIIQHMVNGIDAELYDYYNKINIEVLEGAITNEARRRFQKAKDSYDWDGYGDEYEWRISEDHWEGWNPNKGH